MHNAVLQYYNIVFTLTLDFWKKVLKRIRNDVHIPHHPIGYLCFNILPFLRTPNYSFHF